MQHTLIKTADGSHSLYVNDLDEHYHSIHGAIAEAIHVFIRTGLHYLHEKGFTEISILEIGLGTGLNALLTQIEAEKLNIRIKYTALEAFPLGIELVNQLNYAELITSDNEPHAELVSASDISNINSPAIIFQRIHTCEWEKPALITEKFNLHKINNTLQEVKFETTFDLIYFDAFGPRVQPQMWTEEVFSKIFNSTNPGGTLVTYCAKGEVKRTLKKVGYAVETLPGPPRKREMVRGTR